MDTLDLRHSHFFVAIIHVLSAGLVDPEAKGDQVCGTACHGPKQRGKG